MPGVWIFGSWHYAVFTSIILTRRGHVTWGAGLLLTTISLTFIGAVALIEGIGLLLGISIVLLVSLIAGQTLPAKAAGRAIAFGVFTRHNLSLVGFLPAGLSLTTTGHHPVSFCPAYWVL